MDIVTSEKVIWDTGARAHCFVEFYSIHHCTNHRRVIETPNRGHHDILIFGGSTVRVELAAIYRRCCTVTLKASSKFQYTVLLGFVLYSQILLEVNHTKRGDAWLIDL